MKLLSILFSALLLALSASAATAQNYYVCDNGDDNNDGRSEKSPFRSYEKAMDTFNKMSAGDSILFCRAGTFDITERKWLSNTRCNVDEPCTISNYGNKNLAKPLLISNGETGLNFQNPGESRADGGYIIDGLNLLSKANKASGISFFNDVNDILIKNVQIEGFNVGVHASGANKPIKGSNQANDRIILKNSTIINNASQGWLGGCNDCVIENNLFENNGFRGTAFHHSIYIDSPVKSQSFKVKNITVKNNIIKHSSNSNGICKGTVFVVHGIVENLKIHNNQILETKDHASSGCWGISIDPGNPLDESFVGIEIVGNIIRNVGGLGIGCASCKDVLIADNILIDESDVLRNGISVPNKQEDSLKSVNVKISNNKIINNHQLGVGILLGGQNRFSVTGNDISLSSTDSRSSCIRGLDANLKIDVSKNACNSHTSVSIIDETVPTTEIQVAETTVPELISDEPELVTAPIYSRLVTTVTEVVSNTNTSESNNDITYDRGLEAGSAIEKIANSSTSGVSGSSSGTSGTETTEILQENELSDSTPRSTMLSTSVQESASLIDSSINSDISEITASEPVTTRSSESISSNQTHSVTVNEVTNVIENDIPVDESQCRVFARGRCMMQ